MNKRAVHAFFLPTVALLLSGCGLAPLRVPERVKPANVNADAVLTPATRITRDLVKLPAPKFKIPVAVYAFRDQTGQFKPQPDSNLSNAVTQGAGSILVKSLLDSGWFLPIEREGLQNLLTERRVARAIETPADKGKPGASFPQLMSANFILEGGIVGYESNVRTGGQGANLLGIGGETKYRVDQVTVNLRSVDVRTGQVVNSVSTTKTIFSHEISSSVYKFVAYKTLLQAEGGYSSNEPAQLAVKEAIETAVIHLTLQGIRDRAWALGNEQDWNLPVVQNYLREGESQLADPDVAAAPLEAPLPLRSNSSLVLPAQLPLHMVQVVPGAAVTVPIPPQAQTASPTQSPVPALASTPAAAPAAAPVGPAAQASVLPVPPPSRPSSPPVAILPAPPAPLAKVPTPDLPPRAAVALPPKPLVSAEASRKPLASDDLTDPLAETVPVPGSGPSGAGRTPPPPLRPREPSSKVPGDLAGADVGRQVSFLGGLARVLDRP